ncbi:hypothetical protein F5B22DRAFT_209223 [Xylaria bambusicola]|uniref:uncharacterized protein n=1 Tax=Xylaria bambusicola TaxID=326684 RepID=UPI0020080349|nr:uncharacterized protein F5B22DRAFT_209223 [Xylaria bambusicola]KAI0514927.1 hypothetical protein F5B22DRAFT_209223 [Xylaria bambusicola]
MAVRTDDNGFAMMDEDIRAGNLGAGNGQGTPFLSRTRSLSDGDGSQLSPSPYIIDTSRRTSKDDSALVKDRNEEPIAPVTPRRPEFPMHGLSLHMPPRETNTLAQSPLKPIPLSPKLDHSQIYASPTNILPRRSRGLDFSRAATSLHHSMLAEQASPDSSPIIGGRGMNIPRRSNGEFDTEQPSTSLRSMMSNHERMHISSSVGSTNPIVSDSSSSSEEDDCMDDEMEDAILNTPQVAKSGSQNQNFHPVPWIPGGSPAVNTPSSFRIRPRKLPKKKPRGFAALGFNAASPAALSRSPPSNNLMKEMRDIPMVHPRRESISWAANQLHISGSENEERAIEPGDHSPITPGRDGVRGVVKRVVTRRGNLLPKTKGFARIRAALAEETAPIDSEVRREAEVIRQVRESDMDLEPRIPSGIQNLPLESPNIPTAQSSPKFGNTQEPFDEIPDDDLMSDSALSSSFKQQAMKNSKGQKFWDTFSETGSINGTRVTPPPPVLLPRGSSSGISEDINMDSPSMSAGSGNTGLFGPGTGFVSHGSDSQKSGTPQPTASATPSQTGSVPPTAAEITRRINSKRRREDDFDPHIFKRRAVSPGMSVHNSPIMQSPLQRDNMPWGSRPGSNHGGDKASGTPSENGSSGGSNNNNGGRPITGAKGRVGFQGMSDTNDGLMRMSIE